MKGREERGDEQKLSLLSPLIDLFKKCKLDNNEILVKELECCEIIENLKVVSVRDFPDIKLPMKILLGEYVNKIFTKIFFLFSTLFPP